jgi:hypothetical protein
MIWTRRKAHSIPMWKPWTPRATLRGVAACRQVLQKASGDERLAMEQAEPEFEDAEGDVIARRMRSLAGVKPVRWRMSVILRCA